MNSVNYAQKHDHLFFLLLLLSHENARASCMIQSVVKNNFRFVTKLRVVYCMMAEMKCHICQPDFSFLFWGISKAFNILLCRHSFRKKKKLHSFQSHSRYQEQRRIYFIFCSLIDERPSDFFLSWQDKDFHKALIQSYIMFRQHYMSDCCLNIGNESSFVYQKKYLYKWVFTNTQFENF